MDANKILDADPLDIIFDGRNKQYGAYELRRHYRQRLGKSILIMSGVLCLGVGGIFVSGFIKPDRPIDIPVKDYILTKAPDQPKEKKVEPVVIKPAVPKGVSAPTVLKTLIYSTPKIEKDPPPDQVMPDVDKIENTKIGTANINVGADDVGVVAGPAGVKEGLVNLPAKGNDDGNNGFIPIEKESEYPGGMKAWTRFLERNLFNNLPDDAVQEGIQGSVVLRFVVDVDGSISDISYVSGPKEYYDVAMKAIRKSGKWTPALQNGHYVKSYKSQAITIRLDQ